MSVQRTIERWPHLDVLGEAGERRDGRFRVRGWYIAQNRRAVLTIILKKLVGFAAVWMLFMSVVPVLAMFVADLPRDSAAQRWMIDVIDLRRHAGETLASVDVGLASLIGVDLLITHREFSWKLGVVGFGLIVWRRPVAMCAVWVLGLMFPPLLKHRFSVVFDEKQAVVRRRLLATRYPRVSGIAIQIFADHVSNGPLGTRYRLMMRYGYRGVVIADHMRRHDAEHAAAVLNFANQSACADAAVDQSDPFSEHQLRLTQ